MHQRLIKLIMCFNWGFLFIGSVVGFVFTEPLFAKGIVFGGLITTVNFHLLARTLRKALMPEHLGSHNIILAKYYARFTVSGLIILLLIQQKVVSPLGLFIGLSVVVVSIMVATMVELKKLIFKEAV